MLLRPLPGRLLTDDIEVRVPDGNGGYCDPVPVRHVRVELAQSVCEDSHRAADAGAGTVFIDALMSDGAFEVPAGSRIEYGGRSLWVTECRTYRGVRGRVHHWELGVR